jgi:hypothetical protein
MTAARDRRFPLIHKQQRLLVILGALTCRPKGRKSVRSARHLAGEKSFHPLMHACLELQGNPDSFLARIYLPRHGLDCAKLYYSVLISNQLVNF